MGNGEERKNTNINEGFVRLPQRVLNALLTGGFTLLELKLLLLVARLTYGCHRSWAEFVLTDLKAIGISGSHASETVKRLVKVGYLLRNPDKKYYSLNEDFLLDEVLVKERYSEHKISSLIGKNLFTKTSENSNTTLPNSGTNAIPNKETGTSQKRKVNSSDNTNIEPHNGIKNTTNKDNETIDRSKDRKTMGTSSKEGLAAKFGFEPETYTPPDTDHKKAFETWRKIEPDNPDSFGFYKSMVIKKQVPWDVIDRIVSDTLNLPDIQHRGRYFNSRIKDYVEFNEEENVWEG